MSVARHAGLHHEAAAAQVEHGVLGAAGDAECTRGAAQAAQEPALRDAAQDVVVGEAHAVEAAADDQGAQVADHGLDFGEFGHGGTARGAGGGRDPLSS